MTPFSIGVLIFASTFGGALAGMWLRAVLPESHLSADSQATVKVGIGLIATMTALILGLVTASAKGSFDELDSAVKQTAAEVLTLDRTLARYGPESATARVALYEFIVAVRNRSWPTATRDVLETQVSGAALDAESIFKRVRALPEQNDEQRWLKARALDLGEQLLEARWVVFSHIGSSVPAPFLVVLAFWLTVIFVSFGLYAPKNGTVISMLLVCALSIASAIFLILEMDESFAGVIRISPAPFDFALARMNQ